MRIILYLQVILKEILMLLLKTRDAEVTNLLHVGALNLDNEYVYMHHDISMHRA